MIVANLNILSFIYENERCAKKFTSAFVVLFPWFSDYNQFTQYTHMHIELLLLTGVQRLVN